MIFWGYSREEWLEIKPVLSEHRLRIRGARCWRKHNYFVYLCKPAQVPPNSTIVPDAELLQFVPEPCTETLRRILRERRRFNHAQSNNC